MSSLLGSHWWGRSRDPFGSGGSGGSGSQSRLLDFPYLLHLHCWERSRDHLGSGGSGSQSRLLDMPSLLPSHWYDLSFVYTDLSFVTVGTFLTIWLLMENVTSLPNLHELACNDFQQQMYKLILV
jgi:hypothetical protein